MHWSPAQAKSYTWASGAVDMGCFLCAMVTRVPSTVPGLVGILWIWDKNQRSEEWNHVTFSVSAFASALLGKFFWHFFISFSLFCLNQHFLKKQKYKNKKQMNKQTKNSSLKCPPITLSCRSLSFFLYIRLYLHICEIILLSSTE